MKKSAPTIIAAAVGILGSLALAFWLRGQYAPAAATLQPPVNAVLTTGSDTPKASFRDVPELETSYVTADVWPPNVTVEQGAFTCSVGSTTQNGLPLVTLQKQIGGDAFCVTTVNEGAAGSTYTAYDYRTMRNGFVVDLRFTLRFAGCGNFDAERRALCETERKFFEVDTVVGRLMPQLVIGK